MSLDTRGGATVCIRRRLCCVFWVSIHAPTGGATLLARDSLGLHGGFNPRAHGGRDPSEGSTRAQWGRSFNPRAHGGRDRARRRAGSALKRFQSTRPRGARPSCSPSTTPCSNSFQSTRPRGARPILVVQLRTNPSRFNPRAHGGRDPSCTSCIRQIRQFQSTRPRGARPGVGGQVELGAEVSIHAPTGGATWRDAGVRRAD